MVKLKLYSIQAPFSQCARACFKNPLFCRILTLLAIFLCAVFLRCPEVFSDESTNPYAIDASGSQPWHIQADMLHYDSKKMEYQAIGHAVIQHTQKVLKADQINFSAQTMEAKASGNVSLTVGEDTLSATSIVIDLDEEKGVLYDGEIFFEESHFYIKGRKIEKTEDSTFLVEDAQVTSCDGTDPDWRITGKHLDITINEYAFVKHGKFWVRDVPVFYTPYFVFPVKLDRQSGLLIPKFGISQRKGLEIEQPLYWAMNESSDATFYEYFMAQRGHKLGLEYRYITDPQSQGMIKLDYLKDRKVDDGTPSDSTDWGYDHDDYARPNDNRYWFRTKIDESLFWDFSGKLDLDIVSDQDYLIEFRDGYTGFNQTESDFQNMFSRTIDTYEDPVRVNQVNLNKKGDQYTWNTNLKWYDNVIARRYLDEDKTLQKLPQIQFNTLRQKIGEMPFYYGLDSDYTYFYSIDGTNGHRLDVHPTLYLPGFSTPYFTFDPYVGFRETVWQIIDYEDILTESQKEKRHFRHLVDFHLNLYSELNRVYQVQKPSYEAVKHVIYPEIRYTYIPDLTQDEYPDFDGLVDGINRIDETHQITFYVAQFLIAKHHEKDVDDKTRGAVLRPAYKKTLRFVLEQTYDIGEALADSPEEYRNGKDRRPFLPLDAEFELIPFNFFSISANTQWSYYDNSLVERNLGLVVWDHREDRLGVSYRFTKDELESLNLNAEFKLNRRLLAFGGYERNLLENETVETSLGFVYDHECWSIEAEFIDKPEDRKYQFLVNLNGLGGVGSR